MKFQDFLKTKRTEANMSVYRLAKLTEISAQQLKNYESGTSEPTLSKAQVICKAFGTKYTIG